MEPTAQVNIEQHIIASGNGHTILVIAGDLHADLSSLPAPKPPKKKRKSSISRRWLGASAGMLTSVTAGILAITMPQSPLHSRLSSSPTTSWPEGKTALCKDGRFSESRHRSGTCSSHGGVAQWRFPADDTFWRS